MRKLVRDKVPELLGRSAEKVTGSLLRSYLKDKIAEEAGELINAATFPSDREKVKEEAGDLISAILALCNFNGLCWEEIEGEVVRKGKEKGGFGAGFVMEFPG